MNIFNTPFWESSAIGDKNADEFLKNKLKIKKNRELFQGKRKLKTKIKMNFFTPHENFNSSSKTSNEIHKNLSKIRKRKLNEENYTTSSKKVKEYVPANGTQSIFHNNIQTNIGLTKLNKNKRNDEIGSTKIKKIKAHVHKSEDQVSLQKSKCVRKGQTEIQKNINKVNDKIIDEIKLHKKQKLERQRDVAKIKGTNKPIGKNESSKIMNMSNSKSINISKNKKKILTLRERMMEKLKASRFRYMNEQIYNSESHEAQAHFKKDPDSFHAYHLGYKQQVAKWPINPLDVIIKKIQKMLPNIVIADFGCGEANLAKSVSQKVYSFDLVSVNEHVVACDMSHVPLENDSVDVVVFCLSLMGTNIKDFLYEANRVLKLGGILKIAEVESRFDTVDDFIEGVKRFGFTCIWKDLSHNLFYFLDFTKVFKCKALNKLPTIGLHPCLYKKR